MIRRNIRYQSGFTLLELVLVIFILGILLMASMTFIEGEDAQLRYQRSLEKLDQTISAIIDVRDYQNQPLLSGFVYDNGILPPIPGGMPVDEFELRPLVSQNTSWSGSGQNSWLNYAAYAPHYTGGEAPSSLITFTLEDSFKMFKGYRGSYLPPSELDSSDQFRDDWSVLFDVNIPTINQYDITFSHLLSDGTTPKFIDFTTSITRTIKADDWSVVLSQLNFSVSNETSTVFPATNETAFAAVMVFENSAADEVMARWRTYAFEINISIAPGTTETFTGAAVSWKNNGVILDAAAASAIRIPVGEHLFALISESTESVIDASPELLVPRSSIPIISLTAK